MSEEQSNVVIAGMGPVGMTAALMLAQAGVSVTVLEAGEGLATESRASTFHPSTLEVLKGLGVVDELLELGLVAPSFQYRGRNRDLIANLDLGVLADETEFPYRVQCEQSKLTRIILSHLEAMPNVTLRFNAAVERVEEGKDCAYVYLPGDGFDASYRADWLIGADGANSAVRRTMGIAFEGVTYPERFLVASTTHDFAEDYDNLAYVSYVYDPEEWGVLLRTPSHWRVLFPIDQDESNDQARDPARIEERLQGVVPLETEYPVVHSTIYAVHQRLAAVFGRGRVLLAGDAAHINNPLGGLGMNSGIQDAEAAVQAVLFALAGGDPQIAVDTYARVRRDAAAMDVQRSTQKNYEEMREQDEAERRERRAEMEALANDPLRAKAYLRRASLLSSREVSRQRMARGLSPIRAARPVPAGRRLSDVIREDVLLAGPAGSEADLAYELSAGNLSVKALAEAERRELTIRRLDPDEAAPGVVAEVVRASEVVGFAAVELLESSVPGGLEQSIREAHEARQDLLVIATLDAEPAAVDSLVERAAVCVAAGADVLGLPGTLTVEELARVKTHVPEVPLALLVDGPEERSRIELQLAGVRLLMLTSASTSSLAA